MKKSGIIGIVLVLLIAACGGGYFWVQNNAQELALKELSKAEKNITNLFKSKLNEDVKITYDFRDFQLLSKTLNIENVSLKGTQAELKIDKLSLTGNEDELSIKNLEKFQAIANGESEPVLKIDSMSIKKLNVKQLVDSKDFLDFSKNLNFQNFEINNALLRSNENVPPQEIAFMSIDSVNSGNIENILIKKLLFQDTKSDPKISIEQLSIDKISDLLQIYDDLLIGKKISNLGNALDLGSFEVKGIQIEDRNQSIDIGSFDIKLGRDEKLINSMEISLSGFELDKALLINEGLIAPEILNSFKEDKLKLNTSMNVNADYSISEMSSKISAGFEKLGTFTLETKQGGFSKDIVNYMLNNSDKIGSSEYTNRVNKNATYKLLKSSFTNDGLTQIAMDLAKKNTGLTPDAMVNLVNQEIDKLGELLTADIKEKTKKALTTFIKSGKGIEISIKSKNKEGISITKLTSSMMDGSLANYLELDIKGE